MKISNLKPETAIGYRADVDGLRAVAIILVLVFHAFPKLLPGGFIGVGIFFVISGFLITQIIEKGLTNNKFTFKNFYYRRARRLFPSLALVLLTVIAAAPLLLLGSEIELLGKHIVSGLFFTANFRLTWESGYFDVQEATKPLLHLWSLGVEEQFYFLWPFTLYFLFRARQNARWWITGLALVSFALNVYFVNDHPVGTFFLPHSRFWQIFAGALLAISNDFLAEKIYSKKIISSVLSIFAAITLIIALIVCGSVKNYPGWPALLPVLSAAAFIAAGSNAWFNRRVLASAPIVLIGYISYPLYLWHWPILSYLHIVTFGLASNFLRSVALLVSVVLAFATFYLVELPIRHGTMTFTVRRALVAFVIIFSLGISMQIWGPRINPLPASMSLYKFEGSENIKSDCSVPKALRRGKDVEYCASDKRETAESVVWGDSKAYSIYAGLVADSMPGSRWALLGRSGCAPASGVIRGRYKGDSGDGCLRSNQIILDSITKNNEIHTVLLAVANRVLFVPEYHDAVDSSILKSPSDGILAAIRELEKSGKKVIFLIDNPTLSDPENCTERPISHMVDPTAECSITIEKYREQIRELTKLADRIRAESPEVKIVDPTDALCKDGSCPIADNGKFLYSFSDHLSDEGAQRVAHKILFDQTRVGVYGSNM